MFNLIKSLHFHSFFSRLETLSPQLNSLIQKANVLRKTGLLDKQRLERRSSDLQKAEAEVCHYLLNVMYIDVFQRCYGIRKNSNTYKMHIEGIESDA